MSRLSHSRGFTLIEVLVALAVVAVALAAAVRLGAANVANAAYLRDKSFAEWVALNRVSALQLASAWPAVGEEEGRSPMGERKWRWRTRVEGTFDADVHRVLVSVWEGRREGDPLVTLTAYLPRPPETGDATP